MSANNIGETSVSTGTGDFSLLGAVVDPPNFIYCATFHSFYGANHYFPYKIEDNNNNWELGEGYLSAASTLVRVNVFNNSIGDSTKINFPAGNKRVYVPTDARAFGSKMLNRTNYIMPGPFVGLRSDGAAVANRLYVTPTLITAPCVVTTVAYNCTAAGAAGTTARIGIYNLVKQADSAANFSGRFPLLVDLGTIDTATSGMKFINTNLKLGQGVYGFALISNGVPRFTFTTTNVMDMGISLNTFNGLPLTHAYIEGAAFHAALPADTGAGMTYIINAGSPQVLLKGGVL